MKNLIARTGLAGGEGHVDLVLAGHEAAAADHRHDRPGLGVERDDRRVEALRRRRAGMSRALLGQLLEVGIERRVDLSPPRYSAASRCSTSSPRMLVRLSR